MKMKSLSQILSSLFINHSQCSYLSFHPINNTHTPVTDTFPLTNPIPFSSSKTLIPNPSDSYLTPQKAPIFHLLYQNPHKGHSPTMLRFRTLLPLTLTIFCLVQLSHSLEHSTKSQSGVVTLELWCVAKNNAEDSALASALDWACGAGGADCSPIQNGGPCYDAQDLQLTASYAFNDYYLKHGLNDDACDFSNTAALISLDPSHGSCKFPSSYSVNNASHGTSSSSSSSSMSGTNAAKSIQTNWKYFLTLHLLFPLILRFH